MSNIDKFFVNPETQLTTTLAIGGAGYAITLNEFVALLTAILLIGQLGLLVIKYYKTWKEWKQRNKDVPLKERQRGTEN